MWFDANYMKLNESKCHFLFAKYQWAKVREETIWESNQEKLLGLVIDKKLNFNGHLLILCKTVGAKVTALVRMVKISHLRKINY